MHKPTLKYLGSSSSTILSGNPKIETVFIFNTAWGNGKSDMRESLRNNKAELLLAHLSAISMDFSL